MAAVLVKAFQEQRARHAEELAALQSALEEQRRETQRQRLVHQGAELAEAFGTGAVCLAHHPRVQAAIRKHSSSLSDIARAIVEMSCHWPELRLYEWSLKANMQRMKRISHIATALSAGLLLAVPALAQTIRYVSGPGIDADDCTDEANPCVTIGYAMDQADPGDTISISAGAYTESLEISKSLTLRGAGRDLSGGTVIQAPAQPGQATGRVITIDGGFVVEISDLVIRHGVAVGSATDGDGGGIFNRGATLALANVTIRQNVSLAFGGGIAVYSSSPRLTGVTIEENLTHTGLGGGMYADFSSSPVLTEVEFIGNEAGASGGGMHNSGGSPELVNVVFSGNKGNSGGGMSNSNGTPALTNAAFTGNFAQTDGGGMLNILGSPTFTNVNFAGNRAVERGGGMRNMDNSNPEIRNSILAFNQAGVGAGFSHQIVNDDTSVPTFTHSLAQSCRTIQGWNPGCGDDGGNNPITDASIQFIFVENPDPAQAPTTDSGDVRLQFRNNSKVIDTGNNSFVNGIDSDLDGNPRIIGPAVDLGSYEFTGEIDDIIFRDRFEQ